MFSTSRRSAPSLFLAKRRSESSLTIIEDDPSQLPHSVVSPLSKDRFLPNSPLKTGTFAHLENSPELCRLPPHIRGQEPSPVLQSTIALSKSDLDAIKVAIAKDCPVVLTYGGTISCEMINGVLKPSHKTLQFHKKFGSTVIAKTLLDSSQMTNEDMNAIVDSVKRLIRDGVNTLCLESGTDSASVLANRLLNELGELIEARQCKIMIATSIFSENRGDATTREIYRAQQKQSSGTISLFVATNQSAQVIEMNPRTPISVHKAGTKSAPFIVSAKDAKPPIPPELAQLQQQGYKLVFSNPHKTRQGVIREIKSCAEQKLILVGLGDYNFFAHADVLKTIGQATIVANKIYLTTTFQGSFEIPDKTPYAPRHELEQLGCELLDQTKARMLLEQR